MYATVQTVSVTPPTTVLVPVLSTEPRDGTLQVMLRRVGNDLLVVPTYSSVRTLVEGCGEGQPWAELPVVMVDRQLSVWGATALLDVPLDPSDRVMNEPTGGSEA